MVRWNEQNLEIMPPKRDFDLYIHVKDRQKIKVKPLGGVRRRPHTMAIHLI